MCDCNITTCDCNKSFRTTLSYLDYFMCDYNGTTLFVIVSGLLYV